MKTFRCGPVRALQWDAIAWSNNESVHRRFLAMYDQINLIIAIRHLVISRIIYAVNTKKVFFRTSAT
jgi:hypothetical protein